MLSEIPTHECHECLACSHSRDQKLFPHDTWRKGKNLSLFLSRTVLIAWHQCHVSHLWNIKLFVAKSSVQPVQITFSLLGYSPRRENMRFTSVREGTEYSSSRPYGNYQAKSKKGALISYLKERIEDSMCNPKWCVWELKQDLGVKRIFSLSHWLPTTTHS